MNNMEKPLKFVDLHVHSIYSRHSVWGKDALASPKDIIKVAIKRGLSGVAITDHDSVKGGLVGQKVLKEIETRNGFQVIPGSEILSVDGDIVALGITEDIEPNLPAVETIEKIREAGGVAVAAHPYLHITRNSVNGKYIKNLPRKRNFDGIEVFNASIGYHKNDRARKLADSLRIPGIGSSDAHWTHDIGNGVTGFELPDLVSVNQILEEIRKGNTIPFGKKNSIISRCGLYIGKFFNLLKRPFKKLASL
ncbi:MAG: PHP domain-containing protein [Candidatus Lokiarchaeota archaeon]|nr:PHP domain-containing protein [Candidatus Lokiarchaeota archaeon]